MFACLLVLHAKEAFAVQGDRYDAQRAVIGSKLQDKLQDMQVFGIASIRHHVHTGALLSVHTLCCEHLTCCSKAASHQSSLLWRRATVANCCIKFSALADEAACQHICLALNQCEWMQFLRMCRHLNACRFAGISGWCWCSWL